MTTDPAGTGSHGHRPRPPSTEAGLFRFCPDCATPLVRAELYGRLRPRCPACGFIQWRNPGVGVAGIITEDEVVRLLGVPAMRLGLADPAWEPLPTRTGSGGIGRVLLVRRRAGRHSGWCLPCGWVEYDEEIREALGREMREETGLCIRPGKVFAVHTNFHDPDRQSVGIWFRCVPVGGVLEAGDDADRICFARPDHVEVPLAFPTDRLVLASLASSPADGEAL
jgi:ADP-ribose pyrophosphatase YjhB (NUDIX family)